MANSRFSVSVSVSPRAANRAIPGLAAPSVAVAALDPGSTRLVYAMVAGLVLVGIVFVVLGVWLVRQTRYDPPVLAPLERMGDADWRKRDEATQRRILDEVRPKGAEPLRPEAAAPAFDTEFDLSRREPGSVSDLGPGVSTPTPPPPPTRPSSTVEPQAAADHAPEEDQPLDQEQPDTESAVTESAVTDEASADEGDADEDQPDTDTSSADRAEEPDPDEAPVEPDDEEPEPDEARDDEDGDEPVADEAPDDQDGDEPAAATAAVTEEPPERE